MIGCFISYRRDDSAPWAGRLHDRLAASTDTKLFFDIDSIDLGQDFRTVIASTLDSCDVVLVLIGPTWLEPDERGRRRLDEESDFHRIEIASALQSGLRVIPVLVGGAAMPTASELPADLQSLAFRNALSIDHASFSRDVEVLERALGRVEPRPPPGPASAPLASAAPVGAAPPTPTSSPIVVPPAATIGPAEPVQAVVDSSLPPIPPPPPRDRRSGRAWVAALAVIVVSALIAVIVATSGGDDPTDDASGATTSAGFAPDSTGAVVLPADIDISQQPVDVAVERLRAAGLVVSQATSGCSNSTEPGRVRQVTVGGELNSRIVYGKESDEIDVEAGRALQVGDEVTVWTPSSNPC